MGFTPRKIYTGKKRPIDKFPDYNITLTLPLYSIDKYDKYRFLNKTFCLHSFVCFEINNQHNLLDNQNKRSIISLETIRF